MNRNRRFPTDCSSNARRKTFVGSLGFTLVELLVVIAIIGVLVALLLPAVQAAREAARRTQCINQMRQMSVAMQNHESARKIFPSGGIDPWPRIEDYSAGGRPFAAPKQGLSWAFQILPYLEQNAVHNITTAQDLAATPVAMYFCPSRRPPTASDIGGQQRWLMDYAAITAAPSFGQNEPLGWVDPRNIPGTMQAYAEKIRLGNQEGYCNAKTFWGGSGTGHISGSDPPTFDPSLRSPLVFPTQGVIVRSSYYVVDGTGASGTPEVYDLGLPKPTGFRQISDGASNTMVICEKRIPAGRIDYQGTDDDAGWSDGWDFDTLRLAACPPTPDSAETPNIGTGVNMLAGSSHPGVFICGFADASMHPISFDIDLVTFNLMANKSDGEALDPEAL